MKKTAMILGPSWTNASRRSSKAVKSKLAAAQGEEQEVAEAVAGAPQEVAEVVAGAPVERRVGREE